MGGTFQVTAEYSGLRNLRESNKHGCEMHLECDFSAFRVQTLAWSHPWMVVLDRKGISTSDTVSDFSERLAKDCSKATHLTV